MQLELKLGLTVRTRIRSYSQEFRQDQFLTVESITRYYSQVKAVLGLSVEASTRSYNSGKH